MHLRLPYISQQSRFVVDPYFDDGDGNGRDAYDVDVDGPFP